MEPLYPTDLLSIEGGDPIREFSDGVYARAWKPAKGMEDGRRKNYPAHVYGYLSHTGSVNESHGHVSILVDSLGSMSPQGH